MARGKFLHCGAAKFVVRGVTYGTFRPARGGELYPSPEVVAEDFARMAAHGFNAVRVYTVPPRWFLDLAGTHRLRVLVGLPWEQHVAFLADGATRRSIESRVRAGAAACAGHPALLAFAVGNEIPSPVVRWQGRRPVERFLDRLCESVRAEAPGALVTYVNYPSTEYLEVAAADFCAFNVYLEERRAYEAYLSRLQNLAGNRPLLLAEVGLDSRSNGPRRQGEVIGWQLEQAARQGAAGAFVFAWTDEWHRGGREVEDWDFGLTTRERQPKPALAAAREAFRRFAAAAEGPLPRISVVVCTYNGARTLRETLGHLIQLEYPDYEILVVDDGSTDASAALAREYGARVVSTPNRGLSAARNTGWQAATGSIVAYLDDDAYPDPHWLHHLAAAFAAGGHAAVGGPNIPPPDDGRVAGCVARAPGGPTHVLVSDTEAEHIPGCNMAFRRDVLESLGGFDPQFRVAGDDVDICWRLQQQGGSIGFAPGAMVWHHRRNSVRAYWRQQRGYGRAEALLERKWPEKYNAIGHVRWAGRLYGAGLPGRLRVRQRIYHGVWGTAPFQSAREEAAGLLAVLPTMPEWYFFLLVLAGLCGLAVLWPKLLWALPVFGVALGLTLAQAAAGAAAAGQPGRGGVRLADFLLTVGLHALQPLARLVGRVTSGLTPLRHRLQGGLLVPVPRQVVVWTSRWRPPETTLGRIAGGLRRDGATLVPGGDFDRWDLEVRGGLLGSARLLALCEEHGSGRQLYRFRFWPRFAPEGVALIAVFAALGVAALLDRRWEAGAVLAGLTLLLAGRMWFEASSAMAAVRRQLARGLDAAAESAPEPAAPVAAPLAEPQ